MASRKQECGSKEKSELARFKTLIFAGLWYAAYVVLVILIFEGVYVLVYHAFATTLLPVELYRNVMLFTIGMPVAQHLGLTSLLKKVLVSIMTGVLNGLS